MIAVAGTPQSKTQPQDAAPKTPRIDEHDADYRRLHVRTVQKLTASLRTFVSELRTQPEPEHTQAQSRFITRHTALLREAYALAHGEGSKDYYGQVSQTPARWARRVQPSVTRAAAILGFYAPSVAKMAHVAEQAWKSSVAQQRAASALSDTHSGVQFADSGDPLDQWLVGVSGRVNLQAEITWPGLQDGYAQAGAQDSANPFQYLYWLLGAVLTEHCAQCPQYAAGSPYNAPGSGGNELDATPGDGKTDCGGGCKCYLSYKPGGQLLEAAFSQVWSTWFNPQNLQAFATSARIGADLGYDYDPAVIAAAQANQAKTAPAELQITQASDDELTDAQKAALDAYRVAIDRWDAVRGDLPKAPAFYSANLDEVIVGEGLPDIDAMTPQQRIALFQLWDVLEQWDDATAAAANAKHEAGSDADIDWDIDFDQEFAEQGDGAYVLNNPYPRQAGGRFGFGGIGRIAGALGKVFGHGTGEGEHEGAGRGVGHLGEGVQVHWGGQYEAQAREAFSKLFGRELADHEVAALVGARPGDFVSITGVFANHGDGYRSVSLRLDGEHEAYWAARAIHTGYDKSGNHPEGVTMANAEFHVHDTGHGVGTEVFAREVVALSGMGVKSIETQASKAGLYSYEHGHFIGQHNGFYTWPRLGYDQSLKEIGEYYHFGQAVRDTPELRGAKHVSDILATPHVTDPENGERISGAQWWLRHGVSFRGTFDLHPGSRSMQVLAAYLEEKGKQLPSTELAEPRFEFTGPGDEIEWTAEDDAAADRAWAQLAKTWAAAHHLSELGWVLYDPSQPRGKDGKWVPSGGSRRRGGSAHSGGAKSGSTESAHEGKSGSGSHASVSYDEGARELLHAKLGRAVSDEEVAGLAGALPGAHVTVSRHSWLDVRSADGATHSVVVVMGHSAEQPHGALLNFRTEDAASHAPKAPDPRGLREQVQMARRFGIENLHAKAQQGSRDYEDLPHVGYNARINEHLFTETRSRVSKLPEHLAHAKTLLELISTPEGAAWWRAEGQHPGLDFNTRPGSQSVQVLDRVLREGGNGGLDE